MTRAALLAVLLGLAAAACRRAPIDACGDDLTGAYAAPSGRWMLLDEGDALEAYPLFPDGDATRAPRALALTRAPDGRIAGALHRRYAQGTAFCDAAAAVRVTACRSDVIDLVLSDPLAPVAYEPCAWPRPESSRLEHWRRE